MKRVTLLMGIAAGAIGRTVTALDAFQKADDEWGAELARLFGREAGDVRYVAKGKGEPGSKLRELHDARDAARLAWEKVR